MFRLILVSLGLLSFTASAPAEVKSVPDTTVEATTNALLDVKIVDQSAFINRSLLATVNLPEPIELPDPLPRGSEDCQIVDLRLAPRQDEASPHQLIIQFRPLNTGLVTLPTLELSGTTRDYQTRPAQVIVNEPIRSEEMQLQVLPAKKQVYAGEPLELTLRWQASVDATRLKHLQLAPDFFTDPRVEVVIPRNTADEKHQIGLPIGGRRVIAQRIQNSETNKSLGTIELKIFIRIHEPGIVNFGPTRLDCALLKSRNSRFAQYAAHFNNSLFEATERSESYQRIYTIAEPWSLEVVPLPVDGQSPQFSGLFAPLDIETSINTTEPVIGELMNLELKLSAPNAPHGFLDIPSLSQQSNLRERFLVDENPARLWHAEGTTFVTRIRALTTQVEAIPSLSFQVFDPNTGNYQTLKTEPHPLTVKADGDRTVIELKSLKNTAVHLTHSTTGIWYNRKSQPMNELLNSLFVFSNRFFWILLLAAPILFILARPIVLESRRRQLDPRHAARTTAYRNYQRSPNGSPEKWQAFLALLAAQTDSSKESWTAKDSHKALHALQCSSEDLQLVETAHQQTDAANYSKTSQNLPHTNLDRIAKRIYRMGKRLALIVFAIQLLPHTPAEADTWVEAEQSFAQATKAPAGSEDAQRFYLEAAHTFEAATDTHYGLAWYNAGNAWFKAGETGRAIAAYRQAQAYRPFDSVLRDNLNTARALTLNAVDDTRSWWQRLPLSWLKLLTILFCFATFGSWLTYLRYRKRVVLIGLCVKTALFLGFGSLLTYRETNQTIDAVVATDSVVARKGPGFGYAPAYNEALHDGLECIQIDQRENWSQIKLNDGRKCWLQSDQLCFIKRF